jgi:diacylglycerol kinase (ATP)
LRKRIKIIANPISGRGRAKRLARRVTELLRERGCEVEVAETRTAGDARRFAASVDGFDAIGVVGGDGTINEVANGLPASAPPLGIIPSGTANVLAQELRLKRDPAALARTIADGREVRWDAGIDRGSGRRFLLFAEAGYNASVVHKFHAQRTGPIQQWQYFWWGLKSLIDYEVPSIGVEVDGRELTRSAGWVQVSNVAAYGGPLIFTPGARADDGAFEVMVQHGGHKRDVIRILWAAMMRYLLRLEIEMVDVTFHRARRVRLWSTDARRVPVQVDGDPGGFLPLDVEIVPGGIGVLSP